MRKWGRDSRGCSVSGSPRGGWTVVLAAMSKSKSASKSAQAAEEIKIRAEPIELSQLLKFAGVFDSGGEAKHAINGGKVMVNGVVETAARKKILAGSTVACGERTLVVSLYK